MLRAGVAGLFLERDCWPGRRKNFDVRFIAAMVTSRCDGGEPPPGGELPFTDGEVVSGGGPNGSPMLDCTADSRAISPMAPCSSSGQWGMHRAAASAGVARAGEVRHLLRGRGSAPTPRQGVRRATASPLHHAELPRAEAWRPDVASASTLEAIQLLAGSPEVPPEEPRGLAPLVDGATRGRVLRALRGRDGARGRSCFSPATRRRQHPQPIKEWGCTRSRRPLALKKT